MDQVKLFTYLGSIISKEGRGLEDVKNKIVKALCVFSHLKKVED